MSEMVERVAKAIDKYLNEQEDNSYWAEGIARAAIKAMREPTAAMRRAEVMSHGTMEAYRAMINAALK